MRIFRPISPNDNIQTYLDCVEDLNSNNVPLANIEQIRTEIIGRSGNVSTYVIAEKDEILATATIIFESKLRYADPCCHIEDVAVHPNYRGHGLGKKIMNYCIDIARQQKCYKIKLSCRNGLVDFYRKLGFVKQHNYMVMN